MNVSTLALFCAAALALAVVPGPAVLYIVARSVDQGRFAGIVSALGIGVGGLVHVLAATIGLSTLLASSATAFTIVKYAGAAYLVFLGIRRLLTRDGQERPHTLTEIAEAPLRRRGGRERPEPEDGALLHCVPAAVRRSRRRRSDAADLRPRPDLRRDRALVGHALGARRRHGLVWLRRSRWYLGVKRWVTRIVFVGLGSPRPVRPGPI